MLSSSSPKLFAGMRVLHRLLMPRHPPVALICLTKKKFVQAVSLSYDYYNFRQFIEEFFKRRFMSVILFS
jgi:hypothetical protein